MKRFNFPDNQNQNMMVALGVSGKRAEELGRAFAGVYTNRGSVTANLEYVLNKVNDKCNGISDNELIALTLQFFVNMTNAYDIISFKMNMN